MVRIFGFLVALGFATGAAAQDCTFFCERNDDDSLYDFFTVENVQKLLTEGANIEERDEKGNTLLSHAAQNGNLVMFQMLLKEGADIHTKNDGEMTLLHVVMTAKSAEIGARWEEYYVGSREEYLEIIGFLVNEGLDVNAVSSAGGATPLFVATVLGTPWGAEALIAAGANTEIPSESGIMPLHFAAFPTGMPGLITALVEGGANVNVTDDEGTTPLHYAANSRNTPDVMILVEYDANVNAQNDKGLTPLMFTTDRENAKENMIYLLSVGADPNLRTLAGWTALHYTVDSAPALIAPLLEGGAVPTIRNNDGQIAFDLIRDDPDLIGTEAYLALEAASSK